MDRLQVAARLFEAELINREQYDGALYRLRAYGGFVEDHLLEFGWVEEEALLKFMAELYQTRYLSTEKLKSASVPKAVLDMVPVKLVESTGSIPILYDARSRILTVVMGDPEDLDALGQLRAASGARDVKAVYARPAAVKAAIGKWYRNDEHAFRQIDRPGGQDGRMSIEVFSHTRPEAPEMAPVTAAAAEFLARERVIGDGEIERPSADTAARLTALRKSLAPGPAGTPAEPAVPGVAAKDYVETLNTLVSLLENARGELRGHSAIVARHVRDLARRIGAGPVETHAAVVAAYVHDLGKGSPFHLTALNVAEWEGHRESARKRVETPARLLESVGLPPEAVKAVTHMYERFDGGGFPGGLRGRDIPLGARLLAIADTFADLSQNPRNPFRRILPTGEAMGVLEQYRDAIFDGNLVDHFRLTMADSDLRHRLLEGTRPILVVDEDADQSVALELRLLGHGFEVKVGRSADAALKVLLEREIHLVVLEVDLEPFDGFELLRRAQAEEKSRAVPFLFFTSRSAPDDVARAFEMGAADYVIKPSTTEVLVAKIRQILERRATVTPTAGVSGSLTDMAIPDLVQILAQGRKTGRLRITAPGGRTGEVHFLDGRLVNAACDGRTGEEAFYAMLSIEQGTFALDPDFRPATVLIQASAEALLLEGMRRIDEAGR